MKGGTLHFCFALDGDHLHFPRSFLSRDRVMGVCGVWRVAQVQPPPEHLSARAVTGLFCGLKRQVLPQCPSRHLEGQQPCERIGLLPSGQRRVSALAVRRARSDLLIELRGLRRLLDRCERCIPVHVCCLYRLRAHSFESACMSAEAACIGVMCGCALSIGRLPSGGLRLGPVDAAPSGFARLWLCEAKGAVRGIS